MPVTDLSDERAKELLAGYEALLGTFPSLEELSAEGDPVVKGRSMDDIAHAGERIVWDLLRERVEGARSVRLLDAVQVGNIAVANALDNYDPHVDAPLRGYLLRKIEEGLAAPGAW